MRTSKGNKTEATAEDYLEHAQEINAIAGKALQIEKKNAMAISAKISIGLSLQAAELAGKGMLRSLSYSVAQICQEHRHHDILKLLKKVEYELQQRPEEKFIAYHHFLLWTPIIDGTEYGNTIAAYFDLHFSEGDSAFPRSYFYPDKLVFTGAIPIHAIFVIVEYIIEVAEKVVALVKQ